METNLPNRKHLRLDNHDYDAGTYFVTVCTKDKKHYLGQIINGTMQLSPIGHVLSENLDNIKSHYDDVEIPLFVVMPNHFHAIVIIDGTHTGMLAKNLGRLNRVARIAIAMGDNPKELTHHNSRLASVMGGIKSHVTRYANKHNLQFGWQKRFHDHVIRGRQAGNRIGYYIEHNVDTWDSDCFNTKRPARPRQVAALQNK